MGNKLGQRGPALTVAPTRLAPHGVEPGTRESLTSSCFNWRHRTGKESLIPVSPRGSPELHPSLPALQGKKDNRVKINFENDLPSPRILSWQVKKAEQSKQSLWHFPRWPFPAGTSVCCSYLASYFSRTLEPYDFMKLFLTFIANIHFPSPDL